MTMRRNVKIKAARARVSLRKIAMSASAATHRAFPAWIVADEGGVAFPARAAVLPRVRAELVLHPVSGKKSSGAKGITDVHDAR